MKRLFLFCYRRAARRPEALCAPSPQTSLLANIFRFSPGRGAGRQDETQGILVNSPGAASTSGGSFRCATLAATSCVAAGQIHVAPMLGISARGRFRLPPNHIHLTRINDVWTQYRHGVGSAEDTPYQGTSSPLAMLWPSILRCKLSCHRAAPVASAGNREHRHQPAGICPCRKRHCSPL